MSEYTAIIQQRESRWIGWLVQLPGVNSQGDTREELIENLRAALRESIELSRAGALSGVDSPYEEVTIS